MLHYNAKKNYLTMYVLLALFLGLFTGYLCYEFIPLESQRKVVAESLSVVSSIFLNLIKMIISPLVFSSLVIGIAKMGDIRAIGRIFSKTLLWFMVASVISLVLGLVMVVLLRPGDAMVPLVSHLIGKVDNLHPNIKISDFFLNIVPTSIFASMVKNDILQIVVFSMFFGVALSQMGISGKKLVDIFEIVFDVMLKITGYIMALAPITVFAAVASTITLNGLNILKAYGVFMGEFYLSIATLWAILIFLGWFILGKTIFRLIYMARPAVILAFSTASSESAYPKVQESLTKFGIPIKTSSFVLPIGYSFNLDGSMMYCVFATVFLAQAYGIELTFMQQLTMLGLLMITSKGIAGVPRASLVVIASTLIYFHIPETGLLLLLAVDHFLDMARAATNVLGNTIATAIVSKWEGDLSD